MDAPRECYVAFLDIMGFANFVENSTSESVLKYLISLTTVNDVFDAVDMVLKPLEILFLVSHKVLYKQQKICFN